MITIMMTGQCQKVSSMPDTLVGATGEASGGLKSLEQSPRDVPLPGALSFQR